MARYIITYDLRKPGRNYDELYKRIKAYHRWIHIMESTWAIVSADPPTTIRDNLKAALDDNDKLLVGVLGTSAWTGLPGISDWMKENA